MTESGTAVREDANWVCASLPATCVLTIDGDDAERLRAAVAGLVAEVAGRPLDDQAVLAAAEAMGRATLPTGLVRELVTFRDSGNDAGGLLVRGLPVDAVLPPTPADGMGPRDWWELPVTTLSQLAVSTLLGGVIAYADEKAGRLVQDTIPVRGAERRQENTNSALLELHVEDAFHPHHPDFLTLHCLRGDHDLIGLTVVGSMRDALPRLSTRTVEVLRTPRFRTRLSTSFAEGGHVPPAPVLTGPVDDPDVSVVYGATDGLDGEAADALAEFWAVVVGGLRGAVLEPGDLMIVDNRRAVHGRTGFTPHYDGTDRWLRRCFLVADIRASSAMRARGSRVCAPLSPAGR